MKNQQITKREREKMRLAALKKLGILDSPGEKQYDNLTELAAYICQVPIAMISLIDEDRQWVKSKVGVDICETERKHSFCTHTIESSEGYMEIEDARLDPRFENNPFVVQGEDPIIFYAGYALKDDEGHALGTLCLMDYKPKKLDQTQKDALFTLKNQIEALFELRHKNKKLTDSKNQLNEQNKLLKNFAGAVSHDLKMPLASIVMTIDLLRSKYGEQLGEEGINYLKKLKQSSLGMSEYITHILDYYETDNISSEDYSDEPFGLKGFLENIVDMLNIDGNVEIHFPEENFDLICNRSGLEQVFLNLLGNSLKYNDKKTTIIDIDAKEKENYYYFGITDNGMGIPDKELKNVFNLFSTATDKDRHGKKGHGIGLSTVKKIVEKLGGKIDIKSEVGKYTSFTFTIKKPKVLAKEKI
ncbi:MAG TPA: GAF domain-containing sensor histidine kinase [Flavobacteriaceae bacterium]|nr:GAF domain-containing sensor histidine kinase [Flavobacteriaceae bacterium]